MKWFSSRTDVLYRPLILIILRCFVEDGNEMYQHVKVTCKACRVIFFCSLNRLFVAFALALPSSLLKFPTIGA